MKYFKLVIAALTMTATFAAIAQYPMTNNELDQLNSMVEQQRALQFQYEQQEHNRQMQRMMQEQLRMQRLQQQQMMLIPYGGHSFDSRILLQGQ